MNLFLTKISRSYVKGVMRYLGGPARSPWYLMWLPKPLVSEGLKYGLGIFADENFSYHKQNPPAESSADLFQVLLLRGGGGVQAKFISFFLRRILLQ